MKILVTAGSTQMPIDRVRVISNIFKGRTGVSIAEYLEGKGHDVTLIANPCVTDVSNVFCYKTFEDLEKEMRNEICTGNYDAIIHSAAVSDYKPVDVYKYENCKFESIMKGKVKSNHDELYIKLSKTEKLVDKIRKNWCFTGKLVKFKLEVDISDEDLIEIAKKSRQQSKADFIVANSLEYFQNWTVPKMFIVDSNNDVISCSRAKLPEKILELLI